MKAPIRSIRTLFEGYPGQDTNPSLRDLVAQEAFDEEDSFEVTSALPGEGHALQTGKNPFFGRIGYFTLKKLYQSGKLSPRMQKEAYQALVWYAGGEPNLDAVEVDPVGHCMMPGDYTYPNQGDSELATDEVDLENFNLEDLWRKQ